MKISVFGTGYVGLVTGVCFAEMGNDVICADIDEKKVAQLKQGISPIFEPGLEEKLKANFQAERLTFTSNLSEAIQNSDLLFIAVGTPSDDKGAADLTAVHQVAQTIGNELKEYKVIVNKSTVPVGTQKKVKSIIGEALRKRNAKVEFDVVSNPEFLREGQALEDCLKPNRVVVGCESPRAEKTMRKLYDPFLKSGNPLLVMDPESSEMTKYAANAMLAAKISMMNEFSRICDRVGADIEQVRRGLGTDPRIGQHFIFAGVGYGGSCFPKDVSALIHTGETMDEPMHILRSVKKVNDEQRLRFAGKIRELVGGSVKGLKMAQWGIAFKPGTDDIREAPAMDLMATFLNEGAEICAYDPVAAKNAQAQLNNSRLTFKDNQYDVLKDASVLIITTEWKSFREPNFAKIKTLMKTPRIADGRNIYSPEEMREQGIEYASIGRPGLSRVKGN